MENNIYLTQLANAQPKQYKASKKRKWGRGGGRSRAPNADVPGESGERLNCASEMLRVRSFPQAAGGSFVAAVIKVISDPCQQLLDTTTVSLWVQHRPESILWFETGSFMLKVSDGLSRK